MNQKLIHDLKEYNNCNKKKKKNQFLQLRYKCIAIFINLKMNFYLHAIQIFL